VPGSVRLASSQTSLRPNRSDIHRPCHYVRIKEKFGDRNSFYGRLPASADIQFYYGAHQCSQKRHISSDDRIKENDLSTYTNSKEDSSSPFSTEDGSAFSDVPGTIHGGGRKLAVVYTCKVCETRSAKRFSEQAYRNGVVMVRCPGCDNLHLIADRLGFFEDEEGGWDIEKFMDRMGDKVQAINDDNILELTLTDVAGNGTNDEETVGNGRSDNGNELSGK